MSFSYFLFIQIKPGWIYNLVCSIFIRDVQLKDGLEISQIAYCAKLASPENECKNFDIPLPLSDENRQWRMAGGLVSKKNKKEKQIFTLLIVTFSEKRTKITAPN